MAVVPFHWSHRTRLAHALLPAISPMYPGASSWLAQRLDDVLDGRAACTVVLDQGDVVAAMIVSPKSMRVEKLSTLWVDPTVRNRRVGSLLTGCITARWCRRGVERGYVTASLDVAPALESVLRRHGFRRTAVVGERYGEGRDEVVYEWLPLDANLGFRAPSLTV
jgi:ribosomal protein S18 acetylase RimI-like enzyme